MPKLARTHILTLFVCGWALSLLACVRTQPQIVVITATFDPDTTVVVTPEPLTNFSTVSPTPESTQYFADVPQDYVVQPGDTLSSIAFANGIAVSTLIELNNIQNPDWLSVGQVLKLPAVPTVTTPPDRIISDNQFVRSAYANTLDVYALIDNFPGNIRTATDVVSQSNAYGIRDNYPLTAAEIVERVSVEFSVDPRLLLALLEYKSGWLTNTSIDDESQLYPMRYIDENRQGLYRQLSWAADRLNFAYYGWRYRDLSTIQFLSGERLLLSPELNAGTVGIQYFLSLNNTYSVWEQQVSLSGFRATYERLFGDPFSDEISPLVPNDLVQPQLGLPFAPGEVWFYTGGPHGGWGSGSAWAAVDFAPPDDRNPGDPACYISDFPVRAVNAGVIARQGSGVVVLDLDGDGNEGTGWTILYLHVTVNESKAGDWLNQGDVIGYPSCEGGFSNATHLHIARRYNGEWIPVYCHNCNDVIPRTFTMSGWEIIGFQNQEYQGIMIRDGIERRAEQGRLIPDNRIFW